MADCHSSRRLAQSSRARVGPEMLPCFYAPIGGGLLGLFASTFLAGSLPFWGAPMSALLLTTSLVGPLGLFLGFKFVVLERRQMSKRMMLGFCALAGWTFFGDIFFVLSVASPGFEVRAIILMAVLPVVGAAHLVYMANTERSELAPA